MVDNDPTALLAASPYMPPVLRTGPVLEMSVTLFDADPEVLDLLCYGESPPPHIIMGEE